MIRASHAKQDAAATDAAQSPSPSPSSSSPRSTSCSKRSRVSTKQCKQWNVCSTVAVRAEAANMAAKHLLDRLVVTDVVSLVVNFLVDDSHDGELEWKSMVVAARYGHLELLQLLHMNPRVVCTADAMDFAAQSGHLEVIQWLHRNRTEGCTHRAMDFAAAHGHLEIVRWLHTVRAEGCTRAAMDGAASKGFLEIVQWLYNHRQEGCSQLAMDYAAQYGHVDVVEWLYETLHLLPSTVAMKYAALNGHLQMVQWIYFNTSSPLEGVREYAQCAGQHHVVKWLMNQQQTSMSLLDRLGGGTGQCTIM